MAPATAPDGAPADLVVSSAPGPAGATQVLSRYRDDVWELWPYFEQSNLTPSSKRIDWANVPEQFRAECKAVVYRYWKEGLPGTTPVTRVVICEVTAQCEFTKLIARIGCGRI